MEQIKKMALEVATLIDSKKGIDIKVLDVRGLSSLSDYMIIATGTSDRHVGSIASGVEDGMKALKAVVHHKEGHRASNWTVLDYLDVVVHVFLKEERMFYDLEHIWNEAKEVDIKHITEMS